jgi:hypothetical protein
MGSYVRLQVLTWGHFLRPDECGNWSYKLIANGLIYIGAGVAGGGVYGILLYDLTLVQFIAAIACGFLLIGLGIFLGGKFPPDKRRL